jgi:6-pyruvoyltetrahydropterin/6-carboxytetrahydropterin synthase
MLPSMTDHMDSSTRRLPTSDPLFEVGTARSVRAFHIMPGMPGPEGELHSHDYRIDVVVRRGELADGMVCDLDVLDAALEQVIDAVADENLEKIRPEEHDAVTVEVFARWVHDTLAEPVRAAGGEHLTVRVWESEVAYGGYAGALQ